MHLWHDSRVVEWCSATSLWLVYMWMGRGVWMHPRSVSVSVSDMIWFIWWMWLCVQYTSFIFLGDSYSTPMRTPLILSDCLRGLPSICLWRYMIMIWYDMFLSSWYYYGSDSVCTGECMNSLYNLQNFISVLSIMPKYVSPKYFNCTPTFIFQFIISVISVH